MVVVNVTDDALAECLSLIYQAWKTLAENPSVSLETADTALLKYLRLICVKNGANENNVIKNQKGEEIRFGNWGLTNYVTYLEGKGGISRQMKEAVFKLHNLRNPARYKEFQCSRTTAEKAITVTEYAIGSETRRGRRKVAPGTIQLGVPKNGERHIQRKALALWENRGWVEVGRHSGAVIIQHKYKKWELFEMRVRYLLKLLEFEGMPDVEEFWYEDLGYQIDACGGSDGVFVIFECTSKENLGARSIRNKMKDFLAKRDRIIKRVDELYPKLYHTKIFVLCCEDIEISSHEKQDMTNSGIKLVDSDQIADWTKYFQTMGINLKYHILRALSGFSPVIVDSARDPFFRYDAFRFKTDGKIFYHFLADPESLLKLAYVYRLDLTNPLGYQRELKKSKIKKINDFLSERGNYFANNLVLSFDSLSDDDNWSDFEIKQQGAYSDYGTLKIPKQYCSAEVIDGQHRLYGYYDQTGNKKIRKVLESRRVEDRLSVVAITDPDSTYRPRLFIDINSNQTKVEARRLWALMADVRPMSLMGFTANVVMVLNKLPTFKNRIHIPGITKRRGKKLNIANFGKGLMDRKLFDKTESWNIYLGDRAREPYETAEKFIKKSARRLERFFKLFEYDSEVSSFVFTNNGGNVMLRIIAELLWRKHLGQGVEWSEVNKILPRVVKSIIQKEGLRTVLKRTSSEAERAALAKDTMRILMKRLGVPAVAIRTRK